MVFTMFYNLNHIFRKLKKNKKTLQFSVASFQLKIMQIKKKVEYYSKIPHCQPSQTTFSFLREKPVSQQKAVNCYSGEFK